MKKRFLMIAFLGACIFGKNNIIQADTISESVIYDFENNDNIEFSNKSNNKSFIYEDIERGNVLKLNSANNNDSYVELENPYINKKLQGITISFWIKINKEFSYTGYDCILSFTDNISKFTLESQPYICWNSGLVDDYENWIDIKTDKPAFSQENYNSWVNYCITLDRSKNFKIYINGKKIKNQLIEYGNNFYSNDVLNILDFVTNKKVKLYIGNGSFWGIQECYLDDLTFYDRVLTKTEIKKNINLMNDNNNDTENTIIDIKLKNIDKPNINFEIEKEVENINKSFSFMNLYHIKLVTAVFSSITIILIGVLIYIKYKKKI